MSRPSLDPTALLDAARADRPATDAVARELGRLGLNASAPPPPPPPAPPVVAAAGLGSGLAPSFVAAFAGLALATAVAGGVLLSVPSAKPAAPPGHAIVAPTLPLPPPATPRPPTETAPVTTPTMHLELDDVPARRAPRPGLAEEAALVARARAAVRTDPRTALALVATHDRVFRDGVLGDEVTVVRVEALVAEGRVDEARRIALPYAQGRPGTPVAARLGALVGEPEASRR